MVVSEYGVADPEMVRHVPRTTPLVHLRPTPGPFRGPRHDALEYRVVGANENVKERPVSAHGAACFYPCVPGGYPAVSRLVGEGRRAMSG